MSLCFKSKRLDGVVRQESQEHLPLDASPVPPSPKGARGLLPSGVYIMKKVLQEYRVLWHTLSEHKKNGSPEGPPSLTYLHQCVSKKTYLTFFPFG